MNFATITKGLDKTTKEALKLFLSPDASNSYYKTKNPTSTYAILLLDRARGLQKVKDL